MKKWIEENKEIFQSFKFKLVSAVFLLILIAGFFVGPELYGYVTVILVFYMLHFFSKQAQKENIISPKQKEEALLKLQELEEEATLIREHVEMNGNDLEAKLMLRQLEKEIDEIIVEFKFDK